MSNKDPRDEILKQLDRFLKKTGMRKSTFGRTVANNGMLVDRLRNPDCNVKYNTLVAVQRYITEHMPS